MIKKVLPWIIFILFFALLIFGFSFKDNLNNYVSEMMQKQVSHEIAQSGNTLIDSLYNYSANGFNYEITFLEFGATSCSNCKRMESVLEEIRKKYPTHVNVVFLNVLKSENQNLMKLYGIATIPAQVLIDKNGKEFFRHTGFISANEIEQWFK